MKVNYINETYFKDVRVAQEKKSKDNVMKDVSKIAKRANLESFFSIKKNVDCLKEKIIQDLSMIYFCKTQTNRVGKSLEELGMYPETLPHFNLLGNVFHSPYKIVMISIWPDSPVDMENHNNEYADIRIYFDGKFEDPEDKDIRMAVPEWMYSTLHEKNNPRKDLRAKEFNNYYKETGASYKEPILSDGYIKYCKEQLNKVETIKNDRIAKGEILNNATRRFFNEVYYTFQFPVQLRDIMDKHDLSEKDVFHPDNDGFMLNLIFSKSDRETLKKDIQKYEEYLSDEYSIPVHITLVLGARDRFPGTGRSAGISGNFNEIDIITNKIVGTMYPVP